MNGFAAIAIGSVDVSLTGMVTARIRRGTARMLRELGHCRTEEVAPSGTSHARNERDREDERDQGRNHPTTHRCGSVQRRA